MKIDLDDSNVQVLETTVEEIRSWQDVGDPLEVTFPDLEDFLDKAQGDARIERTTRFVIIQINPENAA